MKRLDPHLLEMPWSMASLWSWHPISQIKFKSAIQFLQVAERHKISLEDSAHLLHLLGFCPPPKLLLTRADPYASMWPASSMGPDAACTVISSAMPSGASLQKCVHTLCAGQNTPSRIHVNVSFSSDINLPWWIICTAYGVPSFQEEHPQLMKQGMQPTSGLWANIWSKSGWLSGPLS